MRLNKKKVISFLIILFLFLTVFSWSQVGRAATSFEDVSGLKDAGTGVGYDTGKKTSDTAKIIGNVIGAVLGLIGVVFLWLVLMGGVDIMLSGGDEEKVRDGRAKIKNGAIGILIIFAAYVFTTGILIFLSGAGVGAPPIFNIDK